MLKTVLIPHLFQSGSMGKTGLILHTMERLARNKNHICIYVDIYATQNLKDFANKLGSAILNAFPERIQPERNS